MSAGIGKKKQRTQKTNQPSSRVGIDTHGENRTNKPMRARSWASPELLVSFYLEVAEIVDDAG